jgi:protocatechuate 3,4-dioxygenase beta subunit
VRTLFVLLVGGLALASVAHAQMLPPETPAARSCGPTPAVGAISYPGFQRIPTTNNLIRPEGKPDEAPGQRVILVGKVLDNQCNPLPGVTVELWQPDPYSKLVIPSKGDMATPQAMFAGGGRTYTQIDGTFSFTTLFPGTLYVCELRNREGKCLKWLERAPFFNIRITGKPVAGPFLVGLFFENDRRNPTDPVYKKLSPENQQRITQRVLPGEPDGIKTYLELVVPVRANTVGY